MEATTTLDRRVRVIPATKTQGAIHSTHDGKKRVAAYCRVSTDSEEQLNSYEAQKSYYTQKIADSPDWEMAGIYADEGISGTSMKKRTEFKKMITACKRGHIDLIITKSLSRFARNTVDCLETVRLLKANGIGVYFEKENINTLTESSEFLITLFSGFAQAESESLSKNIAWGKQKSAEAGKVDFQYKKMLGYRKGVDGQPEIVPEEAEIIRRIYRRYLAGCSLGQIKQELEQDNIPTAQKVERWSSAVIHNILTNEKYMGDALLQKTYITDCITKKVKKNMGERPMYYVENNHPAIILRETFDQVQKEMTRRSSKRKVLQKSGKTELGKYSGKYALTELLVCGECGSPYKRVTWARNGKKRIVWRCVSRLEFGTKYCHNSQTLDESRLHNAILAAMNEYAAIRQEVCPDVLAMVEEAKRAMSQAGTMLLELKKRMDAVSQEQSNVLDRLLANMADAELNARMKALTDEKEALKAQILKVQQKEVSMAEQAAKRQQMWDSLKECSAGYTEFDDEFVRQIIQKITVEDAETIHVHFRDSDVVLEQGLE
jgi:site-specific DNA recombinase